MVECCTFGLPNHDHPFHQTPRLVPQNFNIVCWIVQSIWALPQTETWGPKRPISQYPGYLGLIWGGGDYGVVATPELLVDIYLISEMPRSPGNCLDVPIYFKFCVSRAEDSTERVVSESTRIGRVCREAV